VAVDADEQRLWKLAAEAEEDLARGGRLHDDAALDAYLLGVARRLVTAEALAAVPLRVRVVADTRPNAFSLPNGALYVHTGMLARMEDEAELASVLAHELVHVTHRHVLAEWRRAQGWGAGAAGLVRLASMAGYSRELEREADREAIARMRAAGYEAGAAVAYLERLREWAAAEGLKDEPTPYASHPHLAARIEACRALAAAPGRAAAPDGGRHQPAFLRTTASVLLANARVEVAAGRYRAAWDQVKRFLALHPDHARAHVLLGEVARRDGTAGSDDSAAASYRRALELDPSAADAWRGLGLVLQRRGDAAEARSAFTRYLELAPDAPDRAHVEAALRRP
jgi:predicted Zn-dependent protease